MIFGDRLKQLRLKHNVTQQQLADYLGVNRTSIAGYETKGKHPDFDKLRLLADYFNVTCDYLIGQDDKESRDLTIATHRTMYDENLSEEAQKELDEFVNYLKELHVKCYYNLSHGEHNWQLWSREIDKALMYVTGGEGENSFVGKGV